MCWTHICNVCGSACQCRYLRKPVVEVEIILLNCFSTLFFETRFLTNPRTCHFSWTNRPRSHLLRFTCLCPLLGCVCTATASFHVCDGDLNPGLHAFMANSLPTKPPPSHYLCNFIVFSSCLLAPARNRLSPFSDTC